MSFAPLNKKDYKREKECKRDGDREREGVDESHLTPSQQILIHLSFLAFSQGRLFFSDTFATYP